MGQVMARRLSFWLCSPAMSKRKLGAEFSRYFSRARRRFTARRHRFRTERSFFASLILCAAFAAAAPAGAASFRVTLADGTEIVGVVKSFEDGVYRLATPAGDRTIDADSVRGMEALDGGASAPGGGAGGAAAPGDDVPVPEFTFLTGDAQLIVGRVLSFEDGVYQIETKAGKVSLPVEKVERIEIAWMQTPQAARAAPSVAALAPGAIRLVGSSAMAEALAPALLESFVQDRGGRDARWSRGTAATLRVLTSVTANNGKFSAEMRLRNSGAAIDALVRGEGEIAMMSRPISAEEIQRMAAANPAAAAAPVQEHVVAPGGAVVIVHPSNPIKSLRMDQIADIFSGRARLWSDVGGPERRILLHVPAEGSGLLSVLQARALKDRAILDTANPVASNIEIAEIVAADPAAIGLVEYAHAGNAQALSIVDECGVTHVPAPFSLLTGEYPLSTRLYLYTAAQPPPLVRDFVAYATSGAGQQKIAERGLVGLSPSVDASAIRLPAKAALEAQKTAPEQRIAADLARLANAGSRVSVAFRFNFASADLDPQGEKELDRLADFLKTHRTERQHVGLIGFSDGTGPLENNVKLAERRAKGVAQKLAQKGVTAETVLGAGALFPIACGVSPEAAAKNRRVEAWLY